MSEFNLTEFFLTSILNYGALMFSVTLYISALGTPIPGTFVVLAGGAFMQQGVMEWRTAFLLGLVGVVLGDSTSYAMGRLAKTWVQPRFGQSAAWKNAQTVFDRRGAFAIYLTRCFVTPLAIPTNLIAGSSGYTYWRFLIYDAAGEITWLAFFGGLGFTFGSNWESISQLVSDLSGVLAGVALLGLGVYFLLRRRRKRP
ncbi:SNARE associated Golgi protein [Candidatus Vecturithrix granuli]|uniref:SNARE associated Golgi protein n=1 Tax=Vecturithrix granuli TaxID=1499967 RepID=A0A081BZE0_VECG1|nr:SNARE associated Golgi protein [Candidatus Vecturithrix granuli]